MKVFISHSREDRDYGSAVVSLLRSIGVGANDITFTSDSAYGIPYSENIYSWLKEKISEDPIIIYLLSDNYYSSIACLNEMGAAWIAGNQHLPIFTPNFDFTDKRFTSGALDPRQMGFRIDDPDATPVFVEIISKELEVEEPFSLKQRALETFRSKVVSIAQARSSKSSSPTFPNLMEPPTASSKVPAGWPRATDTHPPQATETIKPLHAPLKPGATQNSDISAPSKPPIERLISDFAAGRLKDEDVLLLFYACDTGRHSLGAGWKEQEEISRIKDWEDMLSCGTILSPKYSSALRRLEIRRLTEVSETTSHGNPRLVKFVPAASDLLLNLPEDIRMKADALVKEGIENSSVSDFDNFSF